MLWSHTFRNFLHFSEQQTNDCGKTEDMTENGEKMAGGGKWPFSALTEKWKVPKSAILLETSGLKIHFVTDVF